MSNNNLSPIDHCYTKIVGVTMDKKNSAGVPFRQIFLEKAANSKVGILTLLREPENPHDKDAIAVLANIDGTRQKLGFIQNRSRVCTLCGTEYPKVEAGIELCSANTDSGKICGGKLLREGLASSLAKWMDEGQKYLCYVQQFTGGNGKNRGCNISLERIIE